MYRRWLTGTALLGLMLVMPAATRAAEDKAEKPAVVVRLASLDSVRADLRYLAEVVGHGEQVKQFDALLQSKLDGIDPKKPIGAYGWVGRTGIDSQLVVLVPVRDQKAFLGLFDNFDAKPDKGDDDVYTVNLDKVPAPVYFRFANDYAYLTLRDKEVLDKNKLLAPAAVLPAGQIGMLSLLVNIDQIPENLRELALGNLENQLANVKDKEVPKETEAEKKLRLAVVDELSSGLKSLFNNGGETALRLDVKRDSSDLSLSLSVAGKAGTSLATTIQNLGRVQSVTASLIGADSAINGAMTVSLPEKLRELLAPAIEDQEKKALARAKEPAEREALGTLLRSLRPTLQSGELDFAADLRGPGEGGLYTGIFGIKVKDGAAIDKALRQIVAGLPPKERKTVTLDVDKVGAVAIHRIVPDRNDAEGKRLFGDNPLYVAVRSNEVLASIGPKGLNALKDAVETTPKSAGVMELQMSLRRLAPLMVKDNPSAPEVARQVFADGKDNDKLRITLEGGKTLKLHLDMKAPLVAFFNKLQQAKKSQAK